MRGDGDGWVDCARGHRHWGHFGAAGLFLEDRDRVLLQHRGLHTHHGGTWGLPGGARDSEESAATAALREASEEVALDPTAVAPVAVFTDDHGGWSYRTVLAALDGAVDPRPGNAETIEARWVALDAVAALPLHPGFAATAEVVTQGLAARRPVLVVDAANVVGSTPDRWWRDRRAVVTRLRDRLRPLCTVDAAEAGGVAGSEFGDDDRLQWMVELVLVVEGAARGVDPAGDVRVHEAPGSGDDAVVEVVRDGVDRGRRVLAVTADRALGARCIAAGAGVRGPTWLRSQVDAVQRAAIAAARAAATEV